MASQRHLQEHRTWSDHQYKHILAQTGKNMENMVTGQYTISQNFLYSYISQRIQRQLAALQNVMLLLKYMNDMCSYYHIYLIFSYTFTIAMSQMTK